MKGHLSQQLAGEEADSLSRSSLAVTQIAPPLLQALWWALGRGQRRQHVGLLFQRPPTPPHCTEYLSGSLTHLNEVQKQLLCSRPTLPRKHPLLLAFKSAVDPAARAF